MERDVAYEPAAADVGADVTAAYHAKYDRYGATTVATVASPEAVRATLKVTPV